MYKRTTINSKIIRFFPMLSSVHENSTHESNPMSQLLYLYLSGSAFLVSFTAPNKQLSSVQSVFKSFDHVSNLCEVYKLTTFTWRKDTLSCHCKYRYTIKLIIVNQLWSKINIWSMWIFSTFLWHSYRTQRFHFITVIPNIIDTYMLI